MTGLVYTKHKAADVLETFLKELGICANFRIAADFLLTRETLRAVQDVKKKIRRLGGVRQAFRIAGMQLLFSGPRSHIKKEICEILLIADNTKRTRQFSKSKPHTLLERTKIGKWSQKYRNKGIYFFIEQAFTGGRGPESKPQTDFYMGVISAAMILAFKGDVETFVCGADWANVFLMYELPALMFNKKIKNINGVPADEFRRIYYSGDKDAVYKTFQKICQTEIALTQERMKTHNKHKRRLARKDFDAQSKFYDVEQQDRSLDVKRGAFIKTLRGIISIKTRGAYSAARPA